MIKLEQVLQSIENEMYSNEIKLAFVKKIEETSHNLNDMNLISNFDVAGVNHILVEFFNHNTSKIEDFVVSATSNPDEFLEHLFISKKVHHCYDGIELEEQQKIASLNCSFGERIITYSCVTDDMQEMIIFTPRLESDCNVHFCIVEEKNIFKALFLI